MIHLFILGDSISLHYGPALTRLLAAGWEVTRKSDDEGGAVAAANLDLAQGANGGDSARVLAYLRQRRRNGGLPAEALLLNCGLHDLKVDPTIGQRQVPLADYETNLRLILTEVAALGPRLLWVRTTPVIDDVHNRHGLTFHRHAADVTAYNAAADRIMRAAGVPVIDLHGFTVSLGPNVYCDHVHYTETVREQQATYLAEALRAWLEPDPPAEPDGR
jgi:lysophospholipase L1-like esterase